MAKCWLCPKEFPNKTMLNSHLVSKEHRRQTVLCVFCPIEKTFMKPGDLERHCRTSHFQECKNMSRSFFATSNCLYFAIFPEDYVRTIAKPESWNSGDAIQARGLMRKHIENQDGGSVKFELIQNGWKRAMKLRLSDESNSTQRETKETREDVPETYIKESRSEVRTEKDENTKSKKEKESDMDMTKGKENTEMKNDEVGVDSKVNDEEIEKVRQEIRKDNYSVQGDKNEVNTTENENKDKEAQKKEGKAKDKDDEAVVKVKEKYKDNDMETDRHKNKSDNEGIQGVTSEEKTNVKVDKTEKESKTYIARKSDDKAEIKDKALKIDKGHKESHKRKHKHKNKGLLGDEKKHIKVKKQKVDTEKDTENKENTKPDKHNYKHKDRGEKSVKKPKTETESSIKEYVKECFIALSDCETSTGTSTPLQDEKEDPLQGELPLVTELLTNKLGFENQKSETRQMKPKKVSFNEYVKRNEEKVSEINKEIIKTDNGKKFSLVRDENNIWRRDTLLAVKENKATKPIIDISKDKLKIRTNQKDNDQNKDFNNGAYTGLPNRWEINTSFCESDLWYDPKGKVEFNTDSKNSDKDLSSGEETTTLDEGRDVPDDVSVEPVVLVKDGKRKIEETQKLEVSKKERIDNREKETRVMVCKPVANTIGHDMGGELQELAKDILRTGVMPLCPPGRRDWGEESQYRIPELNFTWPPVNWKRMTPDRRLLAWEFASMTLQSATEGPLDPGVSRAYLMDKFNYLALPGSAKHVKDREEIAASRARFYCYQMVREIASGKSATSAEEVHLQCLRDVRKVSDDFQLKLRTIDAPLRLNLE